MDTAGQRVRLTTEFYKMPDGTHHKIKLYRMGHQISLRADNADYMYSRKVAQLKPHFISYSLLAARI
jgi:hypothetical protein